MNLDLVSWVMGQIAAIAAGVIFGIWMGASAPGLVVWYALSLLVDIRKRVSE